MMIEQTEVLVKKYSENGITTLTLNHPVHQTDLFRLQRTDHLTGQQHFHGLLAGYVSGQRHHGR